MNNFEKIYFEEYSFNEKTHNEIDHKYFNDYPVLYILRNEREVYIGETARIKKRIKEHIKNKERTNLELISIIGSEYFNKSATFNIETNLINYFFADEKYLPQNKSKTIQEVTHNYYNKEMYDNLIFNIIWEELKQREIVNNSIDEIKNKDIFKISPFTSLSPQQYELREDIIKKIQANINLNKKTIICLNGKAGTGKSVLISSLFNLINEMKSDINNQLYNTKNFLLVNHAEVLKTYIQIARRLKCIKVNQIKKPTPFINEMSRNKSYSDITIVDEAHLLLSQPDAYNNFNYQNQLEEIIKLSKITIIVFDEQQFIKSKGYWSTSLLSKVLKDKEHEFISFNLKEQFRMNASNELISWIDDLVEKKQVNEISFTNTKQYEFKV
ncbi:MAG: DNA/RNA helicase domain-containing protein, partial [Bacilli bacterium]